MAHSKENWYNHLTIASLRTTKPIHPFVPPASYPTYIPRIYLSVCALILTCNKILLKESLHLNLLMEEQLIT